MKGLKKGFVFHLVSLLLIITGLLMGMIYPFIPGDHEIFAIALSLLIQVAGFISLPLVLVGICWMIIPRFRNTWLMISFILAMIVGLVVISVAISSMGYAFAIVLFTLLAIFFYNAFLKMQTIKKENNISSFPIAIYLITIPSILLLAQLVLHQPLHQSSRLKSIQNAATLINDIENYRQQYGSYPATLQAQWKDYSPNIVGIEKYHYTLQGKAYNIQFEQPRFFIHRFGTREWVVYNPIDENSSYSHASWHLLLAPGEMMRRQGWYHSGNPGHQHWKYFLFD